MQKGLFMSTDHLYSYFKSRYTWYENYDFSIDNDSVVEIENVDLSIK